MVFNDNNNENNADNLLNVISIMIGYQNLMENREQSAHNDIEKHNQKQANTILNDLHAKFEEQNHLLQEILNILKGEKKDEL